VITTVVVTTVVVVVFSTAVFDWVSWGGKFNSDTRLFPDLISATDEFCNILLNIVS